MMQLKNYTRHLSLILATSLLVSCGLFQTPDPIIETVFVDRTIPLAPNPKGLVLHPVVFQAVSHKNVDEFLKENEKRNGTVVFIAMDVISYENIALNTAELQRYIKQQKAQIEYYEERLEDE